MAIEHRENIKQPHFENGLEYLEASRASYEKAFEGKTVEVRQGLFQKSIAEATLAQACFMAARGKEGL